MKRLFFLMVFFPSLLIGQGVYIDELELVDTKNMFISSISLVQESGLDKYEWKPVVFEIRNDSLCIVSGDCLVPLGGGGELSFIQSGTGPTATWTISSSGGGATPFFNNNGTWFSGLQWSIAGNSISVGGTISYDDLDDLPTIPNQPWLENGSDIYFNTGNVGIGLNSPSYALHVDGILGLSSNGNVYVGNGVGNDTGSGAGNLAFGANNLLDINLGFSNLSFGSNSMRLSSTANDNVSIGNSAMYSADGAHNVAIGTGAGYYLDGTGNIAIGRSSLDANTSGSSNFVSGYQAFSNNTTGSNNIAIGWRSGYNNITGSSNVFLGYAAGYNETASNLFVVENSTSSTHLLNGTFQFNRIGINKTTSSLTHTLNVGGDMIVDSDAEIEGNLAIGDIVQGQAQFILGLASDETVTSVTTGTGISLVNGALTNTSLSVWTESTQGRIYRNSVESLPYVGIQTTSPTHELHVNGDIRIEGGTIIDTDNSGGSVGQYLGRDAGGVHWETISDSDNQTLSLSNSDLSISSGNTVDLNTLEPELADATMANVSLTGVTNVTALINSGIDNGGVNVNSGTNEIELSYAGFYRIVVSGEIQKDVLDPNRTVTCYIELNGTTDVVLDVFPLNNEDEVKFTLNRIIEITSSNTDIQLEFDLSGTSGATISSLSWNVEKM